MAGDFQGDLVAMEALVLGAGDSAAGELTDALVATASIADGADPICSVGDVKLI